jgi:hypothetical protein
MLGVACYIYGKIYLNFKYVFIGGGSGRGLAPPEVLLYIHTTGCQHKYRLRFTNLGFGAVARGYVISFVAHNHSIERRVCV